MPRYIVTRSFAEGRTLPEDAEPVVRRNAELGVTWVHSYVSHDRGTAFCLYDAPTPDAIRATAHANDLPVDRITEVRLLDPSAAR